MLAPPSRSSATSRWSGNDNSGIAAWAADIPPNAPPPVQNIPFSSELVKSQRTRTLHKSHRAPPNLLKSSRRIAPPCLSMSTTIPPESSKSSPMITSFRPSSADRPLQTCKSASLSKTSSKSAQSDTPLSTPSSSQCQPSVPIFCPSRKSSILGDMYIHVRSWVAPTPAIFVPVQLPHQQRPPLPVHRVDSSSRFRFTTHPPPTKKSLAYEHYIGRGRHLPELAFNDEPPSFRARGRKASRAAA